MKVSTNRAGDSLVFSFSKRLQHILTHGLRRDECYYTDVSDLFGVDRVKGLSPSVNYGRKSDVG